MLNRACESAMFELVDEQRRKNGFLTIEGVLAITSRQNVVYDPFSVLISEAVVLGCGNIIYPGVIMQVVNQGGLVIGNNNTFYPQTLVVADKGKIQIGDNNQFGDGGASIKANRADAIIEVGSFGRYVNGPEILGQTSLGSGSQVLGRITVQSCRLASGEPWSHSEPDKRGAVLKGFGMARSISLRVGQVLHGEGDFSEANVKEQSFYHPKVG